MRANEFVVCAIRKASAYNTKHIKYHPNKVVVRGRYQDSFTLYFVDGENNVIDSVAHVKEFRNETIASIAKYIAMKNLGNYVVKSKLPFSGYPHEFDASDIWFHSAISEVVVA